MRRASQVTQTQPTENEMRKFQIGETYTTRCGERFAILKRSAKRLTAQNQYGETVTVGIKEGGEGEWAFPHGRYSMAPTLRA
tara:strand:+ start:241 stop:486 length:246 start_codon:yes stop_codon:yes gene_type:complete